MSGGGGNWHATLAREMAQLGVSAYPMSLHFGARPPRHHRAQISKGKQGNGPDVGPCKDGLNEVCR